MENKFDFSGWATKANLRCADGRIIAKDAFKDDDGKKVPLIWSHQHNSPENVLGHAILENREDGVYAYCTFNDNPQAQKAKTLVEHKDITALSIFANRLKQDSSKVVFHGNIREVSLVLAGANPGAFIDNVVVHGETSDGDSAVIFFGQPIELCHSDEQTVTENKEDKQNDMEPKTNEKTVQDVIDSMTEEQKTVMYALIGQAMEQAADENNNTEGDNAVKHNLFEGNNAADDVLTHDEQVAIIADAKRNGSLKEAVLQHGIENVGLLFPDNRTLTPTPKFIDNDQSWVAKVMKKVHRSPFSRIKSLFANLTKAEARAKGYITGKKKIDEVFSLLKRTTNPTTVYKKQSMDRDDIVDITDFDVIAFIRSEMRGKLDEELARAFLIGDGRLNSSDDKINEMCIRPIWTDDELFTVNVVLKCERDKRAKEFINSVIRARKNYKGSGKPDLYTSEDMLTDMLLLEDANGRCIYETEEKLATKLRVGEIITVPQMENLTREVSGKNRELLGLVVNLADYNVGADKGGNVTMFDDFDIDYNKQKYLMETRCSGALVTPYSAIAIECEVTDTKKQPTADEDDGVDEGDSE